jgi:hypothetical protein
LSSIDLILKDVVDPYVRENFSRLARYIENQTILAGNWKFYLIEVKSAVLNQEFRHNLTFVPKDIILLSLDGNKNVDFRFDLFTKEHIIFSTQGPAVMRLLVGSYPDNVGFSLRNLSQVPVGGAGAIPGAVGEIAKTMNCGPTVSVGDWVVQSLTLDDTAEKLSNNVGSNPIIGIVKSKPTSLTCNVVYYGFYNLAVGRGRLYLDTSGSAATTTAPGTGNVQHLGISFGNGTILVKPESIVLRRV